jgi:dephospho-CoA kinase
LPIVLALAGGRGSGKTSVSADLTTRLNAERTSFGGYLRSEAHRLGLESTTESLQDLGQRLVSTNPAEFAANVLQSAGWNKKGVLIIDGIRHIEILKALRSLLDPIPLRLVLLKVDSELRKERLRERGDDISMFECLDAAPTEVQIFSALPAAADLVVDGSLSVEEISDIIMKKFVL